MEFESTNNVTVIQGEDHDLNLRIVDKESDGPYDLTLATAINARFKNADGTVLAKDLTSGVSVVLATNGKIKVSLLSAETTLLKARESQDFEIEIVTGTGSASRKMIVQFLKALTVKSRAV